ncbi:MAG TPA: hypothetical protein VJL81_02230 [Solirubrobacterales bacterium]|nr:hypothetical protein [Solirubrobacterales bacterium]
MSLSGRKPVAVLLVIAAFALVVGGVGFYLHSPPDSTGGAIAVGVSSSLIASFVFAVVGAVLIGTRATDLRESLSTLEPSLDRLDNAASILAQTETAQVQALMPKGTYDGDEWLSLLSGAHRSLTMVGHALDKWCRTPPLEAEFRAALSRLAREGGDIRLLILAKQAKRVPNTRRKEYTDRIEETLRVVAGVYRSLGAAERQSLQVRTVGDKLEMPYMAVANENFMIVAPYPATLQSSNGMPAIRVAANSPIAEEFDSDITTLFRDHGRPVDLNNY